MSCDGPGYEHMDVQGIVALITEDNEKEADEAVENKIGVSQPSIAYDLSQAYDHITNEWTSKELLH